jgi:hypothetical protein
MKVWLGEVISVQPIVQGNGDLRLCNLDTLREQLRFLAEPTPMFYAGHSIPTSFRAKAGPGCSAPLRDFQGRVTFPIATPEGARAEEKAARSGRSPTGAAMPRTLAAGTSAPGTVTFLCPGQLSRLPPLCARFRTDRWTPGVQS